MDKGSEKTISYLQIGEVYYVKKRGIRRVSIVVKPFKGVVVTVPYSVSYSDAEHFVLNKMEWIMMAKIKMAKLESRKTIFNESTRFSTKKRELTFKRHHVSQQKVAAEITANKIIISLPEDADIEHESIQDVAVKVIEKAWIMEAKEILPERVKVLANRYGFRYDGLSVKRIKSRWGSCSATNNINLSVYLMNIPDNLIDYVILHELCHTIEKNHGPMFWQLLDNVTNGKAKLLAKEMKRYSTRYF